jgi:hypothetical protein
MKHPAGSGRAAASRFFILPAALGIPLIALVVTLIVEAFNHRVFTTGFASMLDFLETHPLAFAVDALLVMVTLAPAFFLRRRFFYVTLLSAVWLIAGGVNGFILMSRMTPFTTADLTVLNTGLDTLPNYMSTQYIILLAVLLSCAADSADSAGHPRPPERLLLRRRRLLCGALATALSAGALAGSWLLAFQTEQLSTVFANLAFAYEDYGFPYCFLQTWLNKGIRKPRTIQRQRDAAHPQGDRRRYQDHHGLDVNVVYVQLESFMDPEIKGLELSQARAQLARAGGQQFYLRLSAGARGGRRHRQYGVRGAHRHVQRYFGPGEYPYKTCLQDNTIESVAYDLKALGYAAHAIHNHRATFYTRNTVYANLGFDDFTSLEYMPRTAKTPKGWSKDYVLTGQITGAGLHPQSARPGVHRLRPGPRQLSHGEDPAESHRHGDGLPGRLNADAVEYYANQIHEMDEFIGDLTQELSARNEKTILVLYGDHLPSLNLKREDMESGSLYKTEYLIWNNFGLRQRDENLTAYELSATALGSLGITQGYMNRFHQFCEGESTYRTDLKALQYDALYGGNLPLRREVPLCPCRHEDGRAGHHRHGAPPAQRRVVCGGRPLQPLLPDHGGRPPAGDAVRQSPAAGADQGPRHDGLPRPGRQVVDMHKEISATPDVPAANGDTDSKGSRERRSE